MLPSLRHKRQINPLGTLRNLAMVMTLATFLTGSLIPTTAASADANNVKPHKAKKKKAAQRKIANGSAESTTERERRLSRECQGRPNAGACEGYTR